MTDMFCNSNDGNNGDNGSTRALAKKTLEDNGMSSAGDGALTAAGAGGRVFVSHQHAQIVPVDLFITGGAINLSIQVLSTDFSTNGSGVPDLRPGARIEADSRIHIQDYQYYSGVIIIGTGDIRFERLAETRTTLENCILKLPLNTTRFIRIGQTDRDIEVNLINTEINFGGVQNAIQVVNGSRLIWNGGSITGTLPTTLFTGFDRSGFIHLRNVDLSGLSGNLLTPIASEQFIDILLERCKLNAGLTILSTPIIGAGGYRIRLHSCDFADTTFNIIEESYEGSVIDETTIVRTGGMSDGTTPLSLKMTTNANAIEFLQPLVSPPIADWTDRTSLTNFDIEIAIDSPTILNNDDVWMELESPGSDAQGIITSTKLSSILGTPSELTASSASWPNLSGSGKKYRLRATATPGKVGPITARVYSAKPSVDVYYDPIIIQS